MDFAALLELMRNPGEDGLPEDIADQLAAAHESAVSSADAKIGELTEQVTGLTTTANQLKAHNYDLMRSLPSNDDAPTPGTAVGDTEGVEDFEDLFE